MKRFLKKTVSVLMIVVMCLTMAPMQGFVGLDISSLFTSEAKAAGMTDSDGETYWAMSHEEAINFIGFMYDKSKVTEDMMNAGGVYKFLTGGFEKGTIEEYCAKLAFMETAKNNLSNCLSSYNQMADSAYQFLRDYFEDKLSDGSVAESAAWELADGIVDYCDEIVQAYSEGSHSISSECLSLKNAYSNVSTAFDVIEALIVGLGGFNYTWSSSKKDMYTYVSSYISNRSLKNSCSEAFDLINDYNKFALTDGFAYDFILDWASDNHIATLEDFGDYIYYVSKSFNYKGNVFEPTDDLSEYKVIDVQCPTDVYVYNKEGELLLSIIDNVIENKSTDLSASVYDNKKRVALPLSCGYDVVIKGTDEGVMDYYIYEVFNDSVMRTVEHKSIPLTEGCTYTTTVPVEVYTDVKNYNIISETGEEIKADYDSLPPVEDNIVDVIVAEELFDGFPVEIIDLVADAMFNMKSVVDLSAYDISTDDSVALFSAVAKYYPVEYSLMSKSDFTYKIIVSPNLDRIMKIRFYYGDDANLDKYQKRVKDLNAEIDALVAEVEGMNEFEKALYIHDYIVLNSEYDEEFLELKREQGGYLTDEQYQEKYSEYSILINGTGLCGSYALAYRAVLNAAGMECLYLSSKQMNHGWNLVKVDGDWYHVDCCWDDPVPDTYGRAGRTYFLRTDDEIMNLNHYSWTPGQYKANSNKYSNMPRDYDVTQKYNDGKWYYLEGTTLYSSDEYGKNETEIAYISASSIDVDNGKIYFSNGRYIYEYHVDNDERKIVYLVPSKDLGEKASSAFISNFYIDGDDVVFYKKIYKNEKFVILSDKATLEKDKFISFSGVEFETSEVTVDVFDKLTLKTKIPSEIEGMDVSYVWSSSDENIVTVSNNGVITAENVGQAIVSVECLGYTSTCVVNVVGDGFTGSCGENVFWNFDVAQKKLVISGEGEMREFSRNRQPWSNFREKIETITIEKGVTNIGSYAFQLCINLTNVNLSEGMDIIGFESFSYCEKLESIIIPDGATCIGSGVFSRCTNLKEIYIPDTMIEIGKGYGESFKDCYSLTSVYIPSSVEAIGDTVFNGCTGLEEIVVDEDNNYYSSDEYGVWFDKNKTELKQYPIGNGRTVYKIPDSVTKINKYAFKDCSNIENVIMPEGIENIGLYSFRNCTKLTNLTIPYSVSTLNTYFYGCTNLKKVLILNGDCQFSYSDTFDTGNGTVTLYSYGNSSVQSYAEENGLNFVAIDDEPHNHDYFFKDYKDISEGSDGYEYYECYCGNDGYYVPVHYYGKENVTDPTCTIDGNKHKTCLNCGEVEILETIPATGKHDYKLTSTIPGTCTTAPVHTYTCSACGDNYTKEGRIEEGHIYETTVIAPTCDEKGYTKEVCTVCGETTLSDFTSPKGHEFIINKSADYCSAHGTLEYACKNCDYAETVVSDKSELITETVTVEPTCTKSGTKSEVCVLCKSVVAVEILNPLSHEYSTEYTVDKEPTCTAEGQKSQHCTRCDAKRAVTAIESTGHKNTGIINVVDATCTKNGYTGDTFCYDCNTTVATGSSTEMLKHSYSSVVTAPTCTAKGYTTYTCTACGDTYTGDETDIIKHSYTSVVTPVSCTANGYTTYTCTVCSHSYNDNIILSVGHSYNDNGTCTGCGKSRAENCTHMCHKTGIADFIWKIVRFFLKLFKIQPVCSCGVAHY